MNDKKQPEQKGVNKPDAPKQNGNGEAEKGVGQHVRYDQGKTTTDNNPAGQGNEGEEVMPAGRDTPG